LGSCPDAGAGPGLHFGSRLMEIVGGIVWDYSHREVTQIGRELERMEKFGQLNYMIRKTDDERIK